MVNQILPRNAVEDDSPALAGLAPSGDLSRRSPWVKTDAKLLKGLYLVPSGRKASVEKPTNMA